MKSLRWEQRFEHFEGSLKFLEDSLLEENALPVVNAGIIKFYEVSFELGWKVLKDLLLHKGFQNISGPRDVIKEAFQLGWLDGHAWLKLLDERNLLTHTYDAVRATSAVKKIKDEYLKQLQDLRTKISGGTF